MDFKGIRDQNLIKKFSGLSSRPPGSAHATHQQPHYILLSSSKHTTDRRQTHPKSHVAAPSSPPEESLAKLPCLLLLFVHSFTPAVYLCTITTTVVIAYENTDSKEDLHFGPHFKNQITLFLLDQT